MYSERPANLVVARFLHVGHASIAACCHVSVQPDHAGRDRWPGASSSKFLPSFAGCAASKPKHIPQQPAVASLQLIPKGGRSAQLLPCDGYLRALLQSHHLGLLVSIESAKGGGADEFQAYYLAIRVLQRPMG